MYDLGNLGLWVMVDDGMADGGWRMGYGGMYFERKSTGKTVGGCLLRDRVQVKFVGGYSSS
jgi:hypothetical protein